MNTLQIIVRIIFIGLFFLFQKISIAQQCSKDAMTAKYWQYRKNLNEHFVLIDRTPEGCIGNGLTVAGSNMQQILCETELLHGLSIPATSIIMAPNGGWGMIDRNPGPLEDQTFANSKCADDGSPPATQEAHNYLELGSETPHQLGWYLVALASEYELLRQNGQLAAAQQTLEEIFLALQAYRRLDITANCLVKARYEEISANFEVDNCSLNTGLNWQLGACLCGEKYHNGQCPKDNALGAQNDHFDIPCKSNCPWEPDLSGYSGFFIREDATQGLEALHDPSDDKWNIDLVSSDFAMSQVPPCDDNFSRPCYMWKNTGFLSSDQMYVIMLGLAMVKRFVSPNATITTCDGTVYHPLEIAQKIAKGFVNLPKNNTRHVFWPGSDNEDCCFKAVKFSACAGGNFQGLYAGVNYMYNYINPADNQKISFWDYAKWWGGTAQSSLPPYGNNGNGNFVLEAMAVGVDWTELDQFKTNVLITGSYIREKEIFLLMNDVLHPGGPKISADSKELFRQMLCDAPCGGPCTKPFQYDNHDEGWPAFECANTPGWTGQRWEGHPVQDIDWNPQSIYLARQFNGLDYMALYNLYMLTFPEEQTPFYNPETPYAGAGEFLGESAIVGPTTLCPGETGNYSLISSYPPSTIDPLTWKSSAHFILSSTTTNPMKATLHSPAAQGYPTIAVDFEETRAIQQYNPVEIPVSPGISTYPLLPQTGVSVTDVCQLSYIQPITIGTIPYTISTDLNHCSGDYWFHANGQVSSSYTWVIIANPDDPNSSNVTITGSGLNFYYHPRFPGNSGVLTIELKVQTSCGLFTDTFSRTYSCQNSGHNIRVDPNPAQDNIAISIIRNDQSTYYITDPNGIQIRIAPANGGANSLSSQMYSNGQNFSIATLPNGVYSVFATGADISPLSCTLIITR